MRLLVFLTSLLGIATKVWSAVDGNPYDYVAGDTCPGVAFWYWPSCNNGNDQACTPFGDSTVVFDAEDNTGMICVPGYVYCNLGDGCDIQSLPLQPPQ
jgi:hypothetical protein